MNQPDPTAVLARIRQMADYWEQNLPEVIRTPAVVSAIRAAMEPAASAVLPEPTDRAAVLREAAEDLATAFGDPKVKHIGALGASHLRRRAREIEGREADEEQPETPLEKRFRYSERRNDELRAECKRRGKTVLEYAEKIERLEKQLDEVRTQLGAEILRAGQAEDELRRLAVEAHDTGTQQPTDEDVVEAHRLALSFALDADVPAPVAQQPAADYEATTGHLITCLAVAGGGSDPDCPACQPAGQQVAAADGEEVVAPHCDGFPTACPNPVPVPPAPPYHDGGFRCGCYDTP